MKRLFMVFGLAITLTACGGGSDKHESTTEATTKIEATTEMKTIVSSEELISATKKVIADEVGDGERITDVTFDGKNLTIIVDLSGADTSMLTKDMIAETRIESITDAVLSLGNEYYNAWNTVTVDFGDEGAITFDKSTVTDDGYGKYFKVDNIKLK